MPGSGDQGETAHLGPKGHLLHKATPPRLGDAANLFNTEKQRVKQNEEADIYFKTKQDKTSEKEPEISNLPDKELKVMVIMIFTGRMDECTKNFNKDVENRKKNQSELKNKSN